MVSSINIGLWRIGRGLYIWSDETKINRIGSYEQGYVWKRKEEGLIAREVKGTVKVRGGSLMVWGCIWWNRSEERRVGKECA